MSNIQKKLPDGWKSVRLGNICEFIGGMQPPKYTFKYNPEPGYIRLVQIQDFRRSDAAVYIPEEEGKRRFCEDDIMIGRYGPPVFQILRGLSGSYNVALIKAVPNEDALTKDFLFYLLQEPGIQNAVIAQSQRSAGQSGVQKEFLEDYTVFIPSLKEQKRIASILKEQLSEVEKARVSAKEQLEMAKVLPDAYLMQLFTGRESKDWELVKLGNYANKIGSGITPRGGQESYLCSGIPLIRSQNVHFNRFATEGLAFISEEQDIQMTGSRVVEGDILLNITGASIGRICVAPKDLCPANVNQHVSIIRVNDSFIPEFVSLYIANPEFQKSILGMQSGATRQALTKSQIEEFEVPKPSKAEQERIVNLLTSQITESNTLCYSIEEQLEQIDKLPAAILRKAFSGQI